MLSKNIAFVFLSYVPPLYYQDRKVYKYLHVHTTMAREIKAVKGGKVHIKEDAEEIYEKRVTPYGNGAKLDAPKRHIGKKAFIIILRK